MGLYSIQYRFVGRTKNGLTLSWDYLPLSELDRYDFLSPSKSKLNYVFMAVMLNQAILQISLTINRQTALTAGFVGYEGRPVSDGGIC